MTVQDKAPANEAIVCPQCKMVAVASYQPRYFGFYSPGRRHHYPGWSSYHWGGYPYRQAVYEDECPGCQGAIVTLFREGKLKHKCSVCSEKPFKCPVFHPTT
jgi:hypothetical protein